MELWGWINMPLQFYRSSAVTSTLRITLTAWPTLYVLNGIFARVNEIILPYFMMAVGFLLLYIVFTAAKKMNIVTDWLYYGALAFAFTAVIDFIIVLELQGIVSKNFMSFYLDFGEPYLRSAWGCAICLADGTIFYAMYLGLIYLLSKGRNWRSLGIYWACGLISCMIVYFLGIACCNVPVTFCCFLNVPYIVFPIVVLYRALTTEVRGDWKCVTCATSRPSRVVTMLVGAAFAASILISVSRAMASLGANGVITEWIFHVEPILKQTRDPAPFAAIQALFCLFWLVPIQGISFFYTFQPTKPQFLWELALGQAGLVAQAELSHVFASLDPMAKPEFRSDYTSFTFWIINSIVFIAPHAFLWQLLTHRSASISHEKRNGNTFKHSR